MPCVISFFFPSAIASRRSFGQQAWSGTESYGAAMCSLSRKDGWKESAMNPEPSPKYHAYHIEENGWLVKMILPPRRASS